MGAPRGVGATTAVVGGTNQAKEAHQAQAQAHQAKEAHQAQAHQAQAQDPTSTSMLWQPLWAHFWDFRLAGAAGMLLPLQARAAVIPPLRARVPLQWPWIP